MYVHIPIYIYIYRYIHICIQCVRVQRRSIHLLRICAPPCLGMSARTDVDRGKSDCAHQRHKPRAMSDQPLSTTRLSNSAKWVAAEVPMFSLAGAFCAMTLRSFLTTFSKPPLAAR